MNKNNIYIQNQMMNNMNNNLMQNQMMNNMNNNFNQNMNNNNDNNDIYKTEPEDIYPYIKEPKSEIIIVTAENKRKRIIIPKSLRKNELYYTSTKFRCYKYSTIKLFHNTELLDNDDTQIEHLSNGDILLNQ